MFITKEEEIFYMNSFKFFTDLILYGDFYIEGNTDVLYIMFYFTFIKKCLRGEKREK